MRPVDFTSFVGRTQDISPIKQAEDAKPMVEQHNISVINEKKIENKQEQVYSKDNTDSNLEYDSSKEGKGQYQSGHNRKRRKQEEQDDGKVTIKKNISFDVKI